METSLASWQRFPHRRPVASLLLAVVACELVGASGSVFTVVGLASWYPSLTRPALAPPNWVFGPVWTTLFALLGVATWLVWRRAAEPGARRALVVFAGHFVINVAWSGVFFGLQSLLGGLVVIAILWLAIVVTAVLYYRVTPWAGVALLPYLAWVTFAAYLNYAFWTLN
ncbi:TspO/MBR family protein [Haloarculaceae archaeon H-GB2-1]|nr:tryptophan-rich sensory protein [Haloarculaceae archaeon H-GB1-1]MEA5409814.1 TspO/MBR family protein [Haloarculaceae archaeon H-GB2-1]